MLEESKAVKLRIDHHVPSRKRAKIDSSTIVSTYTDNIVDRASCRHLCKADIIIDLVLPFISNYLINAPLQSTNNCGFWLLSSLLPGGIAALLPCRLTPSLIMHQTVICKIVVLVLILLLLSSVFHFCLMKWYRHNTDWIVKNRR